MFDRLPPPPQSTHPALTTLTSRLPTILTRANHPEMWGVTLQTETAASHAPTANILIKFLRANDGDPARAEEQLVQALAWRREMDPLGLRDHGRFSARRFAGLGYQTAYAGPDGNEGREVGLVAMWNIYGGVADLEETFGDVDEFIRWRVALMELAIQDLHLDKATSIIPYHPSPSPSSITPEEEEDQDPYQMHQIHDYRHIRFLRMSPTLRAATRKTIDVFSMAYPELLREKFFVNVPAVMGWMFAAMKMVLSRKTTRKFHPIANGANLAREFPEKVREQLPRAYGGLGPELEECARAVALVDEKELSGPGQSRGPGEVTASNGARSKPADGQEEPGAVTADAT